VVHDCPIVGVRVQRNVRTIGGATPDNSGTMPDPQFVHHRISPLTSWSDLSFTELWSFRDLFGILALRDIKLRYKQTVLGIAWVVLQPLLSAIIFAAVFGNLAKLPSDGAPYILFVFAAMLPWNLLAGGLQRAGNSLVGDANLISKVYFPRIIIPIASSAAVLLDFAVTCGVMVVLSALYGVGPSWTWLAVVPLTALVFVVILGTSFFFSALSVYYRDFKYALPFLIQAWMYGSPLVYATSLVPPRWQILYHLNPMAGIIDGFRWALLGNREFPAMGLLMVVPEALALFVVGLYVFQRVERSFADVI
jgi:lipopolysaccharide transport system permease protein